MGPIDIAHGRRSASSASASPRPGGAGFPSALELPGGWPAAGRAPSPSAQHARERGRPAARFRDPRRGRARAGGGRRGGPGRPPPWPRWPGDGKVLRQRGAGATRARSRRAGREATGAAVPAGAAAGRRSLRRLRHVVFRQARIGAFQSRGADAAVAAGAAAGARPPAFTGAARRERGALRQAEAEARRARRPAHRRLSGGGDRREVVVVPVHDLLETGADVELPARRMAGRDQPFVRGEMAGHAGLGDGGRLALQVAQPRAHGLGVGALHLMRIEVAAGRTVAALAGDAGVGVAAEHGGMAGHAGSLHVIGVGQTDGLGIGAGLGPVELLARVVVRLVLVLGRLFLLPLRRLPVMVVAGSALRRPYHGLGARRGCRCQDQRADHYDGARREHEETKLSFKAAAVSTPNGASSTDVTAVCAPRLTARVQNG